MNWRFPGWGRFCCIILCCIMLYLDTVDICICVAAVGFVLPVFIAPINQRIPAPHLHLHLHLPLPPFFFFFSSSFILGGGHRSLTNK